MIEIGVNIVEIVTKGLYTNSLDIFREYIQNACDAIDDAIDAGILAEGDDKSAGDGKIAIELDAAARRITIEDNGMGIPTRYFERTMSKIGNSDKTLKTDRGFRGIGRLCGLAYCREARFSSTAVGEPKLSVITIDAERLRKEFFSDNKHSAESVLRDVMTFSKETCAVDEHFFKVELIDIVDTNNALLDVEKVRDYLSFTAPVTYSPNFYYQSEIYKHAAVLNFKITEYKIEVNGEPVVKNYKTTVQTRMGKDEIFGVDFRDFKDDAGNLIAWIWIGLSNFKGVLDQTGGTADNKMRGIRLRAGNIQIGDAEALKNLFAEARGTTYFIGEVHTVDTNLRPNSRRDYFEENEACNALEGALRDYFRELHTIYKTASDVRSAYKAIDAPADTEAEFKKQSAPYRKSHQSEHDVEIVKLNKAATTAEKKIASIRQASEQAPDTPLSRVVFRMTENKIIPPQSTLQVQMENQRRLISRNNFRRQIGRGNSAMFIGRLKASYSTTLNWLARLFSTRLKRSLPNEPPRLANRAELQEQIYPVKFTQAKLVLPFYLQGRRALLQG